MNLKLVDEDIFGRPKIKPLGIALILVVVIPVGIVCVALT